MAQDRTKYYSISEFPSNVYDGDYIRVNYMDESKINVSGMRPVHMLEMSLSKSFEGSTLSFSGSVVNLESKSFSGSMLVFVTENQLVDANYGVTWNFVFRDYGLNKTLSLAGLSTDTFSGAWNIPNDVKVSNIQVIAAVYDIDSRDPIYKRPYAVQSVCDICGHSVARMPALIGDVNGDGAVDIFDVVILANAFGSKPGDPNWKTETDLSNNGVVDIFDVVTIAINFGKTL